MFKVKSKYSDSEEEIIVYASRQYTLSYEYSSYTKELTEFLVYENDWIWVSASNYEPIDNNKTI